MKQRDGAAFENMDSVLHLRKARFRSAADRRNSERHPLGKNLKKRFLAGFPVTPDHHKIHRRVALETRLREERCNKGVPIDFRRLRLKNEPHRHVFIRLIADVGKERKHRALCLLLLRSQRLLPGLRARVRDRLDFRKHLCGRGLRRKLRHNETPLVMRHLLKLIADADTKRAAAGPVRFPDH